MTVQPNRCLAFAGLLVLLLVLALLPVLEESSVAQSGPIEAVYDLDWQLRYYLKDGTLYSLDWQVQYYVRDDSVFDKRWIKRYYLRDSALYDGDWHRRYYIKELKTPESAGK
jgi:hypothetical protein